MKYISHSEIIFIVFILSIFDMAGRTHHVVVADSVSHMPLPSASIFDGQGRIIGICNSEGQMPYISDSSYPVIVRYLGFKEKSVTTASCDTIFLQENFKYMTKI